MIKVGALHFTNSFPLFFAIQEKIIPNDISISWGTSTEINRMLLCGEVDVAMISSVDFLNNRFSYILLSDLGIAVTKQIFSVRLFFKGESPSLHNETVYVPEINVTSVQLLNTVCKCFWKVSPNIKEFTCPPEDLFHQDAPFLLTGDTCLANLRQSSHSSIDIAQAWNTATGKSFIFAVIATRNDTFQQSPQEVIYFHRILEDSYRWAIENRDVFVGKAAKKTQCSEKFMENYFEKIEYRLTSKHFHGLDYFAGLRE